MKFKKRLGVFLLLSFVLTDFVVYSQKTVIELYDSEKYEKCIKLCDENIKDRKNKKQSYLYKSLSLIEAHNNKKVQKLYSEPFYEALKNLKKIESYKQKEPEDPFISENIEKLKDIRKKSITAADIYLDYGNKKAALKIYKKLFEIYPNEKGYIFKLLKFSEFEKQIVLRQIDDYSVDDLDRDFYEIVSNSTKYLPETGEKELEKGLEFMLNMENCDLELVSIMLVFLKENYSSNAKLSDLTEKFRKKFWQVDMLLKVNEYRKSGYTCGSDTIESKPPLVLDVCLIRTCQKYAMLCCRERHFSHTGPDGKSPWTRANEEGCSADGENIAMGSRTVDGALNQWMNSHGHCKNIMGYHKYMGIGESGTYWVQMFK